MIILKSLDTLEFKFKHRFHKLGLYNLIDNSGSIHNSKLFQQYSINIQSVIFHLLLTPPPDFSCGFATRKKGETALGLSLNPDVNCDIFLLVLRPIKNDLVLSWDGMSQLSQITVMFLVNLKKSFNVIVEPRLNKISQIDKCIR